MIAYRVIDHGAGEKNNDDGASALFWETVLSSWLPFKAESK
jgi:hypothetical protein